MNNTSEVEGSDVSGCNLCDRARMHVCERNEREGEGARDSKRERIVLVGGVTLRVHCRMNTIQYIYGVCTRADNTIIINVQV